MDETSIAFDTPMARAVATGGTELPDRISVRDHIREVEIGAFRAEQGVTQRVRFNVVLEVTRHAAARDDDVDKVLSYDSITQAITDILAAERVNLLETLAERLAARILDDPRAVRAFLRIEKLDRIPGALGVEIVRTRLSDEAPTIAPLKVETARPVRSARPEVFLLSSQVQAGPYLSQWLDVIAKAEAAVICVTPRAGFETRLDGDPGLRQTLLSIEQSCWDLAAYDSRVLVVDSRTELDWALLNGRLSVWAPQRLVMSATNRPGSAQPADLALWLGGQIGAATVHVIGGSYAHDDAVQHKADGFRTFKE